MRDSFGVHAVDDSHLVHMLGHSRKEIGDGSTAFAVLTKSPKGLHNPLIRAEFSGVRKFARIVERHHLAVLSIQQRLRIERINLAYSPLHEQEDDSLCSRSMVQVAERLLGQQTRRSQATKATGGLLQESSAMTHLNGSVTWWTTYTVRSGLAAIEISIIVPTVRGDCDANTFSIITVRNGSRSRKKGAEPKPLGFPPGELDRPTPVPQARDPAPGYFGRR